MPINTGETVQYIAGLLKRNDVLIDSIADLERENNQLKTRILELEYGQEEMQATIRARNEQITESETVLEERTNMLLTYEQKWRAECKKNANLELDLKAAQDHAATMEAAAIEAEKRLEESVPWEVFQSGCIHVYTNNNPWVCCNSFERPPCIRSKCPRIKGRRNDKDT